MEPPFSSCDAAGVHESRRRRRRRRRRRKRRRKLT